LDFTFLLDSSEPLSCSANIFASVLGHYPLSFVSIAYYSFYTFYPSNSTFANMRFASYLLLAASLASSVYGHALITAATGANGVNGVGFGVVDGTTNSTFSDLVC
jgi:hypothetical protein